ncbi:MAG: hypothetical protein WC647_07710 [Desulfomonilaceae bacterium]|jgi:hypothetical protein
MPTPITIIEIEKEIKSLSRDEQLMLMEKLVRQLRKSGQSDSELDWKHLYGLGKDLWRTEDAQEYVNSLREDRL